jgi:NAD(P)-dependent dehydrogenase (short-subunit alcohol dehydrogenase family)
MTRLEGERIVVTGASTGLGREMALRYAAEGARVGLLSRSDADLEAVADEAAGETLVLPTDVTETEQVSGAIDEVFGAGGGVDTLINNVRKSEALPQPITDLRFLRAPASACSPSTTRGSRCTRPPRRTGRTSST